METLDLKLPCSDVTLILDALRHYIAYINDLDDDAVDEDTLSDLLNDNEVLKGLESSIALQFAEKFGEY
ncbi:hypothetical protein DU002_03500 [Corallincola holothuriorum]|uniref:Uncharacterized protein n=1 Tax=Corallincola holothuriorum TaxID=2282215 RepID=A0A368NLX3_9GAMM|nr:hypothetical protein [Corallincola holothuriorum]RCU51547.1 hypothetical protein DU002_03500 [Corallincola holothuriorum]